MNTLNVTFFGDSICVGQGVSLYKGWVPRIARDLDALSQSREFELVVTNASVNGRTTRQALEDMPYTVQSHAPQVVIVQFGLNDCNHWASDQGVPRVSLDAFKANLMEIMIRACRFGAKALILNSNHPTTRDVDVLPFTQITYEDSNRAYNEAIRSVAKDAQCEFGDMFQFVDMEVVFFSATAGKTEALSRLLLADALHLSAAGHDVYYDALAPIVTETIERITSV